MQDHHNVADRHADLCMSQAVKPQTSDFDLSRTSANRSRIRFANENGSLFNNDLMHKLQHNSCINSTEKYKFQIFHFCIDRAMVNQLMLLLHRFLHEMKIVQTILDEYLDTETVSLPKDSESVALAVQLLPHLQCC